MEKTTIIYVNLLDEGTPTIRPTQALKVKPGIYKLLPTADYDPIDEVWEFLPETLVKATSVMTDDGEEVMLAIEQVSSE